MRPITETPNELRRITDDVDAKLFLIQQGLMDKLLQYGKPTDRTGLSEPWSARIYHTDHSTHWIVADFYSGFANPADNGYVVECIPKSRCSLEQFRLRERARAPSRFPNDIEGAEGGTLRPPEN